MEDQEHQEFDADAAFEEAVKSIESGELPADDSSADATGTITDKPDQPEQIESAQENSGADLPEWLSNASDEVKDYFHKSEAEKKRLAHMERSQRGRVGSLTKKYQQAMNSIAQVQQQSGNHAADIENLRGDYPELADVLTRIVAGQDKRLADISNPLAQIAEANVQELSGQQSDAATFDVYQAVPDVESIVSNPAFHSWLDTLPAGVKAMSVSDDPADVIYLLGEFKRITFAQQVQRERKTQQLSAMTLPNGRNAPKGGSEDVDEDALFARLANDFKKRR